MLFQWAIVQVSTLVGSDKMYLKLTGSLRHMWPKPELKGLQMLTKHTSWMAWNIPKDP